jgi:RimK family alpha-L-glutamate ligase
MEKSISNFVFKGAPKQKKEKASSLIILTTRLGSKGTVAPTVKKIVNKCKNRGIKCVVLDTPYGEIEKTEIGTYLIGNKGESKTEVDVSNTMILPRRSSIENTAAVKFFQKLESLGFTSINPLKSVLMCEDKLDTCEKLFERGIPVPKTSLISNINDIKEAVEEAGGKFPLIAKLLSGTKGIGVFQIDSHASLVSTLQTIWKLSPETEMILQEKIDADYDLRIHVLGNRDGSDEGYNYSVIGAMKRIKIEGDFRTNFSLGGQTETVELTSEIEEIAIKCAKSTGCGWCGVDIIVENGTGKPYVLEVNASPGTDGIEKTTGLEITDMVLDFMSNKKNWSHPTKIIGFREIFTVKGVGNFVGKSDTGNGAISCSLHADSFEQEDGFLNWSIGEKSFKNRIIEFSHPEIGTETEKRPVILLDVEFDGTLYKKVKFSVVDRTNKSTPLLINRTFMEKAGLVIDPSRTFIVTNKPKGYNPGEAKGDNLGGIELS